MNAELIDDQVRGVMSGSGEQHTLHFYVHSGRLETGPDEVWWSRRVTVAGYIGWLPASEQAAAASAALLLQQNAIGGVRFIPDMCTVSLLDTAVLDTARKATIDA